MELISQWSKFYGKKRKGNKVDFKCVNSKIKLRFLNIKNKKILEKRVGMKNETLCC